LEGRRSLSEIDIRSCKKKETPENGRSEKFLENLRRYNNRGVRAEHKLSSDCRCSSNGKDNKPKGVESTLKHVSLGKKTPGQERTDRCGRTVKKARPGGEGNAIKVSRTKGKGFFS